MTQHGSGAAPNPAFPEWIEELSAERYQPMLRLLDKSDFEFLRKQKGISEKHIARLRQQRCRIFQGYLHSLEDDFHRVAMAIKMLIADSQEDRGDLARVLLQYQARFARAMVQVKFRLLLFRWGIGGVDVSRLVKLLDGVHVELRTLAPSAVEA